MSHLRARLDGAAPLEAGVGPMVLGLGGALLPTAGVVAGSLSVGVRRIRDAEAMSGWAGWTRCR